MAVSDADFTDVGKVHSTTDMLRCTRQRSGQNGHTEPAKHYQSSPPSFASANPAQQASASDSSAASQQALLSVDVAAGNQVTANVGADKKAAISRRVIAVSDARAAEEGSLVNF